MKYYVIKKNKIVNSYCSVGLFAGAIVVVLLAVFGDFENTVSTKNAPISRKKREGCENLCLSPVITRAARDRVSRV